jgi:L-fucose mutarotase
MQWRNGVVNHRSPAADSPCGLPAVEFAACKLPANCANSGRSHGAQKGQAVLKGLDPILNPDLLQTLRAMGHGDDLVIADANFPSTSMARRLIRLDGLPGPRVLEAILSVLPLDDFVPDPALRIEVVGDPAAVPEVCADYARILARPEHGGVGLGTIERFAFYERSKQAFAVVATGETRLYGCVLLKKGVIRPA